MMSHLIGISTHFFILLALSANIFNPNCGSALNVISHCTLSNWKHSWMTIWLEGTRRLVLKETYERSSWPDFDLCLKKKKKNFQMKTFFFFFFYISLGKLQSLCWIWHSFQYKFWIVTERQWSWEFSVMLALPLTGDLCAVRGFCETSLAASLYSSPAGLFLIDLAPS